MPDQIDALRQLTLSMYEHTRDQRSALSASRAASQQFVHSAPTSRKSEAEQRRLLWDMQSTLTNHLLRSH